VDHVEVMCLVVMREESGLRAFELEKSEEKEGKKETTTLACSSLLRHKSLLFPQDASGRGSVQRISTRTRLNSCDFSRTTSPSVE
jgi:hypothetical protein